MVPLPFRGGAVLAAALTLLATGCQKEAAPPGGAVHRYTVRGEVVQLRDGPPRELMLRHEAIDDFVDRTGAVVGMNAMTMPFPVEAALPLDGIAPGDKVRVRFSMDWEKSRMAVESVEELPPDTALEFRKARPPAAAPR
ncbi:MAG TPA: copper-binding protein [Anaeromyxobacteraceae bacterium]|nr:copper-binding protein [Anaeromyxobacteraceae bacterium]